MNMVYSNNSLFKSDEKQLLSEQKFWIGWIINVVLLLIILYNKYTYGGRFVQMRYLFGEHT